MLLRTAVATPRSNRRTSSCGDRSYTVGRLGRSMRRPDTDFLVSRAPTCRNATLPRLRTVALSLLSVWVVPTWARAADPASTPRIDLRWAAMSRARVHHTAPVLDPASGWALRYARELEWTQRALVDPPRASERWAGGDGLEPPSPHAWSTMATATARLVTRGLGILEVHEDHRLRRRHTLLGYFRSRGVNVAWRVEF